MRYVFRSALLRRNHDFIAAADDLLIAMDKTGHDESNPVYKDAQKQLLFTYNDFAVQCFKYVCQFHLNFILCDFVGT